MSRNVMFAVLLVFAGLEGGQGADTVYMERVVWFPGPTSGDSAHAMQIDRDGSIFVAGSHGGLDLDRNGAVDVQSQGIDPLIMKLRADGSVSWVRSPAAPGLQRGERLALDRTGGVYAAGMLADTVRFSDDLAVKSTRSGHYIVRYDPDGNPLWVRAARGGLLADIVSDLRGTIYFTGSGRGRFTLDGHDNELGAPDAHTQLLGSYDPQGRLRWLRRFASRNWMLRNLQVGPEGDIFVIGLSGESESVDLDGDGRPEIDPAVHGRRAFIARFDADGRYRAAWGISAPKTQPQGAAGFADLVILPDGDLLLTGGIMGAADFDRDGRPDAESKIPGAASAFLARYAPDGTLRWVRSYGIDQAWDVATDGRRIVLAGTYKGERDLNGDGVIDERDRIGYPLDRKRESEWVMLVLTEDGRLVQAINAPGPGNDQARAVAFLPDRPAVYVAGFIQLTADFTGDQDDNEGYLRCDALGDLVLARYRFEGGTGGAQECRIEVEARLRPDEGRRVAELTWSGAVGAEVSIHRDGVRIATTGNDGVFTDDLPPDLRGTVTYEVRETEERWCTGRTELALRGAAR